MSTTDDVNAYFSSILRRPADQSALNYWVPAIDNEAESLESLTNALLGTPEFANVMAVIRLYQGVFDRLPDEGGLDFWNGHFQNMRNTGPEDLLGDLIQLLQLGNWTQSQEYLDKYGPNLTTTELVTAMYDNVLNREPDAEGLAFWVNEIDSGNVPREEMIAVFTESDEFKGNVNSEITGLVVHDAHNDSPITDDDAYEAYIAGDNGDIWVGELFNEAPTDIEGGTNNEFYIPEAAAELSFPVGSLTVADRDAGDDFTWAIVSDPSGYLDLGVPTNTAGIDLNGQVIVSFVPGSDVNVGEQYTFTVEVADSHSQTYQESFDIFIT